MALAWPCAPRLAHATVTEPNGVAVPTDKTGGGELRLDAFFAGEGEPIDWRADAYSTPATFSPLCGFRATLKRVDSGSKFGVGWYNVDPNATTPPTAVFPIVPRNATPGQVFTGDDIRSSPSYAGGLIGFALIREGSSPPYHYSESKWNTVCDLGCFASPGPWALSLTYQSKNLPNAWYMGFEDGSATNLGWSNDGDFNDSLFLFEGLSCEGGGEPCEVAGVEGACQAGLTECSGGGDVSCKQVVKPQTEVCDGVDNDCEGGIDEGDGLCPPNQLCYQGSCVPNCNSAEFPCGPGTTCEQGVCVELACAGVTCAPGTACVGGQCVAPCDGVTCPGTQQCVLGRCVDPCAGVECGAGRVCERGICVDECGCRGCGAGLACQKGTHRDAGKCVPAACLDVTCSPGDACTEASGGTCEPLCGPSVTCPRGQTCSGGACVEGSPMDGGSGAGGATGSGGGTLVFGSGGDVGATGGATGGGSPGAAADGGTTLYHPAAVPPPPALGCGCRTATRAPTPLAGCISAAAGVALLVARRRARRWRVLRRPARPSTR